MKKILSFLGAITIVGTGASSVVSCAPYEKIDIESLSPDQSYFFEDFSTFFKSDRKVGDVELDLVNLFLLSIRDEVKSMCYGHTDPDTGQFMKNSYWYGKDPKTIWQSFQASELTLYSKDNKNKNGDVMLHGTDNRIDLGELLKTDTKDIGNSITFNYTYTSSSTHFGDAGKGKSQTITLTNGTPNPHSDFSWAK